MDLKQNNVPFSSPAPAPRKPQPRNQEQQVNNAQPIVSATEVVASNVDAVENGIHEDEGMLTFTEIIFMLLRTNLCFYNYQNTEYRLYQLNIGGISVLK